MKKYYHKGEQVKTIGAPYMFNGGEFIDAHDANGENITLPTHGARSKGNSQSSMPQRKRATCWGKRSTFSAN